VQIANAERNTYCDGKVRIISSINQKTALKEYYTTNIDLKERVCFTHLRRVDDLLTDEYQATLLP